MSNNIEIAIVCNDEDDKISALSRKTGLDILRITDQDGIDNCGGNKLLAGLSMYGCCYRCSDISLEMIKSLIVNFKEVDFYFPEIAVLIIDDENNRFSAVVKRIEDTVVEKGLFDE